MVNLPATFAAFAAQGPPCPVSCARASAEALPSVMPQPATTHRDVVDFAQLPPLDCPCGTARRAFADAPDFPCTIHRTDISTEARTHYHKRLTEVYYILQCDADAQMELDGCRVPIAAGTCVMVRPNVRHRAIGRMQVLIVVYPKFDPADEWFD
jgi:mannose-6-phosphate isomerase-like protein (cupin superfamily)